MKYEGMYFLRKYLIVKFLAVLVMLLAGFDSARNERGVLPVKVFTAKNYGALPQNWGITQDQRGIIYVANEEGILEFDGENWRKIMITTNANRGRAVDFGFNNRVYVGARDEFGFLEPDKKGVMHFVSLMPLLDSAMYEHVGDMWNIAATASGVYFRARSHVFFYNGSEIKVFSASATIHRIFKTASGIVANVREEGLCIPSGDSLKPLVNSKITLKDSIIPDAYGIIQLVNDDYLAVSRSKGIFTFRIHGNELLVLKHMTNLPAHILSNFSSIFHLARLDDTRFSIGTWGGGVWFFDIHGNLLRVITTRSGLSGDIITGQFTDRSGYLWLSHSNGISVVMSHSPLNHYSRETTDLEGLVESIIRFNNRVYVATHNGLFVMNTPSNPDDPAFLEAASFTRIGQDLINSECFHLSLFEHAGDSMLLICVNDGVYAMNVRQEIVRIQRSLPWSSFQSGRYPDKLMVALESGIGILHYAKGKFNQLGNVPGLQSECKNIYEDDKGRLWVGTINDGVYRIDNLLFSDSTVTSAGILHFDSAAGLESGKPCFVNGWRQYVFAGTSNGIYRYNESLSRFEYDSLVNKHCDSYEMFIHRLSAEKTGDLWMVIMHDEGKWSEVRYISIKDQRSATPWADDQREIVNAGFHEGEGITWLGGTTGLFRYDKKAHQLPKADFNTYLRLAMSGKDTVFGGTWFEGGQVLHHQPQSLIPVLRYRQNSLLFRFAGISPFSDGQLKYSYWLEGSDEKEWSDWTLNIEKEYTFLHEGRYRFHVRAKDVFGNISQSDVFEYVIKPPWYRTIWAYIAYILFFILFVWIAIYVSTRSLQKIIKERTAEIVKQKDVIEQKNKDIMDSISYARRIQETILPSKALVQKHLPNSFIFYKPRDIVSGDFYWLAHRAGKTLVAAADCTGHGVPGAFMSILGVTFLNEITARREVQRANHVLGQLRDSVIQSLSHDGVEGGAKDGMDIAFLVLDNAEKTCEFSGAYNSLLIVRQGEVIEYKADRMPIGSHTRQDDPFTNYQVDVQKDDMLYIFSDGFIDQFGGPEGKKFMSKRFKETLVQISVLPIEKQKDELYRINNEWRGEIEQVDDIIVIGIRIEW